MVSPWRSEGMVNDLSLINSRYEYQSGGKCPTMLAIREPLPDPMTFFELRDADDRDCSPSDRQTWFLESMIAVILLERWDNQIKREANYNGGDSCPSSKGRSTSRAKMDQALIPIRRKSTHQISKEVGPAQIRRWRARTAKPYAGAGSYTKPHLQSSEWC